MKPILVRMAVEAFGICFDGHRRETRNTLRRYSLIRKSFSAVLGLKWVSGGVVEMAVGHCKCYSHVPREAWSAFIASTGLLNSAIGNRAVSGIVCETARRT